MTLAELHRMIHRTSYALSSEEIPLKMHGCEIGLELELKDGYVDVKLKRKPISVEEFKKEIIGDQKQMPAEFAQLVQDNFWDLVNDHPEQNIPISDKQDRESKKW